MNIRKMHIDDYEQVYALWLLCKGMGLNSVDDTMDGIKRFLERNPETCFVAVSDSIIVGVIIAGNDGRRGYIYHTAVNPDFRRQGIGKELVNAALEALKRCGITKTALVVFEHNQEGNEFWEEMGFVSRNDLVYRNKTLVEMIRIDT